MSKEPKGALYTASGRKPVSCVRAAVEAIELYGGRGLVVGRNPYADADAVWDAMNPAVHRRTVVRDSQAVFDVKDVEVGGPVRFVRSDATIIGTRFVWVLFQDDDPGSRWQSDILSRLIPTTGPDPLFTPEQEVKTTPYTLLADDGPKNLSVNRRGYREHLLDDREPPVEVVGAPAPADSLTPVTIQPQHVLVLKSKMSREQFQAFVSNLKRTGITSPIVQIPPDEDVTTLPQTVDGLLEFCRRSGMQDAHVVESDSVRVVIGYTYGMGEGAARSAVQAFMAGVEWPQVEVRQARLPVEVVSIDFALGDPLADDPANRAAVLDPALRDVDPPPHLSYTELKRLAEESPAVRALLRARGVDFDGDGE